MILLYHKVSNIIPTYRWVSVDAFNSQMAGLKSKKVVYLDDYDYTNSDHVAITFDGGYDNIATMATPILKKWGYPFEVFVIGKYIGGDNTFDTHAEPFCRFASIDQLKYIADNGGRIQWHTKTHRILRDVPEEIIREEVLVPEDIRRIFPTPHFGWFAYPHGLSDAIAINLVRSSFNGALATGKGVITDKYNYVRTTIREKTTFFKNKIHIVIYSNGKSEDLTVTLDSLRYQNIASDFRHVVGGTLTTLESLICSTYDARAYDLSRTDYISIHDILIHSFEDFPDSDTVIFVHAGMHLKQSFIERIRAMIDEDDEGRVVYEQKEDNTQDNTSGFCLCAAMLLEYFRNEIATARIRNLESCDFYVDMSKKYHSKETFTELNLSLLLNQRKKNRKQITALNKKLKATAQKLSKVKKKKSILRWIVMYFSSFFTKKRENIKL